ncbi:MAG: OsmC family protein [Chloroflexota bacterium]|nr:OsmC family protein [Chloroflexota bacterium]
MADAEQIKRAAERNIKAMSLRSSVGQGTATTTVRVRSGATACDIEDGPWKLVADLDRGMGGGAEGPDPGVFARSGLGACLAVGYLLWAARLGVQLDNVQVVIETDYDARGMYAVNEDVSPGWGGVRCTVTIASPDAPERVREVVERADRYSPIFDDFTRALDIKRELRIDTRKEA